MKYNTKLTLFTLAAFGAVGACGESGSELGSRFVRSELIPTTGGSITVTSNDSAELVGTSITVPAGALSADTTITLAPVDTVIPASADIDVAGPAVDFGPDGTQFSTPVTIKLPLFNEGEGPLVVWVREEDGSTELIDEGVTREGELMVFTVDHFTAFQGGRGTSRAGCTSDTDCSTEEECSAAGACVAAPECRRDADCSSGEECSASGTCEAAPECRSDADCASDEACTPAGTCAPAPECTVDADCDARELCERGSCVPLSPGTCRTDADCAAGEACNASGMCAPVSSCVTNADCGRGERCEIMPGGRTGVCEVWDCMTDRDCAGLSCVRNICI